MRRRERIVSIDLSEKHCCLPLLFVVRGFQDLMTEGSFAPSLPLRNYTSLPYHSGTVWAYSLDRDLSIFHSSHQDT